jgi:hypothetical protein
MDRARGILFSLSEAETSTMRFDRERNASLRKALAETIGANLSLLVLTACLFGLIRHHGQVLKQEATQSKQELALRDLQLGKLTSTPFQPSPLADLCHRGERSLAIGELRGISTTTRP